MRGAHGDVDAVVLGQLRELRVQPVGARDHRGRHPVHPPHPSGAAQGGEGVMHRTGDVAEGHLLTDHRPKPA